MKSSTSYKLSLAQSAIKNKLAVEMRVRGAGPNIVYKVSALRDLKHSVLLTLDRNGGFIVVDPDDILAVWVPKLPPAFEESQPHA